MTGMSDLTNRFALQFFRKTGGILVSWIAGVLLCAGDFLMACAIDLLLGKHYLWKLTHH